MRRAAHQLQPAPKDATLGQEEFLNLMITQLKNQDPFKPMESGEFLGQIAQFENLGGRLTKDDRLPVEVYRRVGQVSAQHDRVVAAYTLLSAVGMLDAASLKLSVRRYDPADNYYQVRDKWHGVRTPDGR